MSDRDERIRQRAYEIWEREGKQHGLDQHHWEQARKEIDGTGNGSGDTGSIPPGATPEAGSPPGAKPAAKPRAKAAPKKPKSAKP